MSDESTPPQTPYVVPPSGGLSGVDPSINPSLSIVSEGAHAPSVAGASAASALSRAFCGLGAAGCALAFVWLGWGAPPLLRGLGLAWGALGVCWPVGYLYSLALALPWFGIDPGHQPHLCLLELGLMGLVGQHLALRALGRIAPRRAWLDPWIALFVAYSWLTLLPSWRWLQCELLFYKSHFLCRIANHSGDADVFGLQLAIKLTLGAGLYLVIRDRPRPAHARGLWIALVGALTLTALAGWLNFAGWLPLGWWRPENPDVTRFGYARLQSIFWHPGWLAQYIEALAPAALAGGLLARRARIRWPLLGLALFLFATQLFTMQRAGWIGLAGGYGCVCLLAWAGAEKAYQTRWREFFGRRYFWRFFLPLGGVCVLAVLAVLASPVFRHRLGEMFVYQHRTGIWRSALTLFHRSPLTGVGLGNYCHTHQQVFPPESPLWGQDKINAHNLYLNLAVERGVIGLALFAVILAGLLWQGVCAGLGTRASLGQTSGADQARDRWLWLSLTGGLVALSLDGLFQVYFYLYIIELLFWLIAGMLTWTTAVDESSAILSAAAPRTSASTAHWRWPRAGWVLAFLALAGAVFWTHRTDCLATWVIFVDDAQHGLLIGGKQVSLPLPPAARQVTLHVGTLDPSAVPYPLEVTVSTGGEVLRKVMLDKRERVELALDIPAGHRPADPLLVTISRTWVPWAYGIRCYPFPEMGVLYFASWMVK